jgi:hypothetical protein
VQFYIRLRLPWITCFAVPSDVAATPKKAIAKKVTPTNRLPAAKGTPTSTKGVPAVCKKILAALAELSVFATTSHRKKQIAVACGYQSVETKVFREALKKLRDDNDIIYCAGQKVELTEQGRAKVGSSTNKPKSNTEMQAHIMEVIKVKGSKQACGKMIEALKDGSAKPRLQLALEMGYKRIDSSGFCDCFKSLRDNQIIETINDPISKQPSVRLADMAFPEGRPTT